MLNCAGHIVIKKHRTREKLFCYEKIVLPVRTTGSQFTVQRPARFSFLENSRDFFWNFTSRSRVIFISLSLLDLDFQSFSFHFHFSKRVKGTKISPFFSRKKEWNFTPSFMKNLTILVSRVKNPKQIMSGIMNGDTQLFIQDTTTNNSRFRFLLPILKVLHKKIKCFWGLCPVGKSDKH